MARKVADACRNCGAALGPGAAFCTLCGAAVPNRSASSGGGSVPLGSQGLGTADLASGQTVQASDLAPKDTSASSSGYGSASPVQAVPAQSIPGIIPVGSLRNSPVVAPQQVGESQQYLQQELENAGAGRRLVAKIIDGLLPGILLGVAMGVGMLITMNTAETVGGQMKLNLMWFGILTGIASLLSIGYFVWIWMNEAKKGTTPGNSMMGLRTTNMEGEPAGMLAIFLRYLIIALGSLIPYVGTILVVISNAWDKNDKKQGWHDKVAHTLVFNVKTGRNPLETGGITGRIKYQAPVQHGISSVSSPIPGAASAAGSNMQGSNVQGSNAHGSNVPGSNLPGQYGALGLFNGSQQPGQNQQQDNPFAPPAQGSGSFSAPNEPITAVPFGKAAQANSGFQAPGFENQGFQNQGFQEQGFQNQGQAQQIQPQQDAQNPFAPSTSFAPPAQQQQNANQFQHNPAQYNPAQGQSGAQAPNHGTSADDDLGETRVRPAQQSTQFTLTFDDGRSEVVSAAALIGRNPAGYDGEMVESLIAIQDSSRSVSKTHLLVRVAPGGLWITDRNSTNGSAITAAGGVRTALIGGTPTMAETGATVHFGDRSFTVGRQ